MFYDPAEDEEPEHPHAEDIEKFRTRWDLLEEDLRKIGLYDGATMVVPLPTGGLALAATVTVGNVAFGDRVQHPEKFSVDNEFAGIEASLQADVFLDERARLRRNIEAGRDPHDDGPDA